VGEERRLVDVIVERKKRRIGHVLRGDGLLREVIEGRMEGKRPRGRPGIGMLDGLKEGSFGDMKGELRTYQNGDIGCTGPAARQNNDDDDDYCNHRQMIPAAGAKSKRPSGV
jgi:hypothetical protein